MSYGVSGLAIAVEIGLLAARRRRALKLVEEERELEAQD
jgi:hypothetical protein